jgi:hypothetical protein
VYGEMAKGNMQVCVEYDSRDELGNMRALSGRPTGSSAPFGCISRNFPRSPGADMCIQVDIDYPAFTR